MEGPDKIEGIVMYWGYNDVLARSRSPNDDTKILVMLYKCGCFHL